MRAGLPQIRSAVATAGAATLLLLGAPAALAAPGGSGSDAAITVTPSCTAVQVTSSKAISNVVLEFANGDRQRFEDLPESRIGTFAGTGDDAGEVIAIAWVKSGNNKSTDGPGYGERFVLGTTGCDEGAPTTSDDEPTGDDGDEADEDEDGKVDHAEDDQDGDEHDETGDNGDDADRSDDDGDNGDRTEADGDREPEVGSDGDERATGAADDQQDEVSDTGADDEPATAVATTSFERDTPRSTPDLAPQVLGVVLDRDLSAAGAGILSAGELPVTGSDPLLALLAALGSIGIGAAALRRRPTA